MSRQVDAAAAPPPRLNLRGIVTAVPAQHSHSGLHRDRWAAAPAIQHLPRTNTDTGAASATSKVMHGSVRERARAYEQRYNGSSNGRAMESGARTTVMTSVKASTAATDIASTEGAGKVGAGRMGAGKERLLSFPMRDSSMLISVILLRS